MSVLMKFPMNTPIFTVLNESNSLFQNTTFPLPAVVLTGNCKFSLSQECLPLDHILFLHKHICIDIEMMWELEQMTVNQCNNDLWRRERIYRLTASNFYNIYIRQDNYKNLANNIYDAHFRDLSRIPSIAHGQTYETVARNFIRNEHKVKLLRKVGLISSPYFPYLGASPDGLFQTDDDTYLLEIKCIFNPEGKDIDELSNRSNFCLNKSSGEWKLKHNHPYYYQMQGQLALSNLSKCQFLLLYKLPNFIHSEVIMFNKDLWLNMEEKLKKFYINYYLPLITSKSNSSGFD